MENNAYRQFREVLGNFFLKLAADFFREGGGPKSEFWLEKRSELERLHYAKKERDKFNNLCKKNLLNETFLTKKNRTFNLGKYLEEIRYSPEKSEIYLRVRFLNGSTIKVEDILSCIFNKNREEFFSLTIVREKINLK